MKSPYLSVVLPSYDELANLHKGVLDKVKIYLEKQKFSYEVIIVDDGSTDGSITFVELFVKENSTFRLIQNKHLGKADTVTTGMLAAQGEYILFADMDQATPIEEIQKLLPFFERGYDVVIGSRNTSRKGAPFVRVIISRASIILRKILVGLQDISDTQCGFKMFKHYAALKIFNKVQSLHKGDETITQSSVTSGFDSELLLIARNAGFKIKEVPVEWLYVETRRVSAVRDSFDGIKALLRIRYNEFTGKYTI